MNFVVLIKKGTAPLIFITNDNVGYDDVVKALGKKSGYEVHVQDGQTPTVAVTAQQIAREANG